MQIPAGAFAGKIVGPRSFGISPQLRSALAASGAAVFHVHGLWMYPGLAARLVANKTNSPRIVSPHGMLESWALNNSKWKKRAAGFLFEKRNLDSATCLHALCWPEAEGFRRFGLANPIAIIPNGIDLSKSHDLPARNILEQRFPALQGRKLVLFLSRIHPKKGLPHLLQAWATLQKPEKGKRKWNDWMLVVAGPDEAGHESEMKELVGRQGLQEFVTFTGPLHGEDKKAGLGAAEIFVLPSFSEGFSMAVLEAASAGLPVLMTPQCNFPELTKVGGAMEAQTDEDSFVEGLTRLLDLSDDERRLMGQRGRELVAKQYSWPRVAEQMLGVYRWMLGEGGRPECVKEG